MSEPREPEDRKRIHAATAQFPQKIHRDCMQLAFVEGFRAALAYDRTPPFSGVVDEYEMFIEENFND